MSAASPPTRDALHARLMAFVDAPEAAAFDRLALDVVAYQARALPPYGRLVAARGGLPARWQDAPLVPTDLFRDLDLCSQPHTARVFRTSGTTGGGPEAAAPRRGARRVPDLRLYDAAMVAPFVSHVLADDPTPRPWLSLVPAAAVAPESSLSHMVDALGDRFARPLHHLLPARGAPDPVRFRALVAAADEPVLVLTTAFALVAILDVLGAAPEPLPPGSRMMLTGGFKGRAGEIAEDALVERVRATLGLPPEAIVAEYGMTELTSQAYGRPLVANPGLRLRVVDPATLQDRPPDREGLVACFDLLNLDNVSAILTGDRGVLDAAGGLTLLGRAPGAVLRGCSLTAEELLG